MNFAGTGSDSPLGNIDVEGARRQIGLCRDAGVNLIDTADVYSNGLSEEILGEALGKDRDEVLVATKVRFPMGAGPNDAGLSRHHIVKAAEASLRRLRTDHIDLYQAHEWDGQTPLEETLSAFDSLVRSGKVRYVGASNYSAWHLMKALGVSERNGFARFVSQQIYYSLQAREAEYELVPLAVDQGLGILVWSPMAGGLLSGKYRSSGPGAPEGSRHLRPDWHEPPIYDEKKLDDTIDVLVEVASGKGVSAAQVALAYLMAKPAVTSVVIGARTEEQLRDNLAASDLLLGADEMARLDEVSAQPLLYPTGTRPQTPRSGSARLISRCSAGTSARSIRTAGAPGVDQALERTFASRYCLTTANWLAPSRPASASTAWALPLPRYWPKR